MIQPLSNYVLLEPIDPPDKSAGGVLIPDVAKLDRPQRGRVVATGIGDGTSQLAIGDYVLTRYFAGQFVTIKGKRLFFVHADEIILIAPEDVVRRVQRVRRVSVDATGEYKVG